MAYFPPIPQSGPAPDMYGAYLGGQRARLQDDRTRMENAVLGADVERKQKRDALWMQVRGDPKAFAERGGLGLLEPGEAAAFQAKLRLVEESDRKRAQEDQARSSRTRWAQSRATGGNLAPTRENVAKAQEAVDFVNAFGDKAIDKLMPTPKEAMAVPLRSRLVDPSTGRVLTEAGDEPRKRIAVRQGQNGTIIYYDDGTTEFEADPEEFKAKTYGGSSAEERMGAKVETLRVKQKHGETLSDEEQAFLDWAGPILSKRGNFAPSDTEKKYEFEGALEAKAADPNLTPDERQRAANALADLRAARAKAGTVLGTTELPGGGSYQTLVRVPPTNAAPTGAAATPPAGSGALPGRVVGSRPAEALPTTIQTDTAQNMDAGRILVEMVSDLEGMDLLGESTAGSRVRGWGAAGQAYVPEVFGENPKAGSFVKNRDNFRLAAQAAVKGTPSDKDMTSVLKTLPSLGESNQGRRESLLSSLKRIRGLVHAAIVHNQGTGKQMHPGLQPLLQSLDATIPRLESMRKPGKKLPVVQLRGGSDPLGLRK